MQKTMIIGLVFITFVTIIIGCGKKVDKASDRDIQNIAVIDSLLRVRGDSVSALIDEGMRNATDSMTWHEYYIRKAKYFGLSATPDSQLAVIDRVEKYAKRNIHTDRGKQLLAFAYNCRAAYYHNFHRNTKETIGLYKDAYNLIMESDNKSQAPNVAANLGDAYDFENDLPKAAMWYRRALFLTDSLNLPDKDNVTLYLGFARICQELGDDNTALYYYQQTEKHFNEISVSMEAYFLNNYGNYYYYMYKYDKALSKFISLRKLLEKNGMQDNFDMFLCKINLADVYLNLDSLKQAKECLDEVEPFAHKNGDPAMLYYGHTIRIGIAVKEKNWNEVKQLANSEKSISGIPFQLRQIRNRYLGDYYMATDNYEQAYKDLRADRAYNDSLEHKRINMRTADIITQFTSDTLKLHSDLAMEHQQSVTNQTRFVAVIAIILAVTFILMFILLRLRSRKRFSDAIIKITDLRLSNARNRFSPHFVFNVLNNYIISNKEDDKDTLLKLTKFIRGGLDLSHNTIVNLEDEMDYAKVYINLEKTMAGDDFDCDLSISDDINLKETYVPSMLIQLMVENAFVHGLNGWKGHKMLKIQLQKEDRFINISVTDNGPGFNVMAMRKRKGHGLDIIRQTIAVLNSRNKLKIIFNMTNLKDADGHVKGCQMTLSVPDNLKNILNITNFKPAL